MPAPIVHGPVSPGSTTPGTNAPAAAPQALQAVRNARLALGTPYVWGGTNLQKGVDCSGLCGTAYRLAGVNLPRTSQEQYASLNIKVSKGQEIPGDLIFSYMNEGGVSGPGHVVMSLGKGKVIAADHTGTPVRIEDASVFDSVYVGSRRVVPFAGHGSFTGHGISVPGSGVVSDIGSGLSTLTDPSTWRRIGEAILGFVLIIIAMYLLVKNA